MHIHIYICMYIYIHICRRGSFGDPSLKSRPTTTSICAERTIASQSAPEVAFFSRLPIYSKPTISWSWSIKNCVACIYTCMNRWMYTYIAWTTKVSRMMGQLSMCIQINIYPIHFGFGFFGDPGIQYMHMSIDTGWRLPQESSPTKL